MRKCNGMTSIILRMNQDTDQAVLKYTFLSHPLKNGWEQHFKILLHHFHQTMRIFNVFIDCKVKGIYFVTRSASWDCLARQSISIDVRYKREFKSDDEVNISAEDKDVDVTIANDDHNKMSVSVVG